MTHNSATPATAQRSFVIGDSEFQVLLASLDVFSRLCQGQLDRLVELVVEGEGGATEKSAGSDDAVQQFKQAVFHLQSNGFWPIHSDQIPQLGRDAYALYKTLRNVA